MQTIEELKTTLESIPASVCGYAVLVDKESSKYYFIEHPAESVWLINGDLWYNHTRKDFNKFELLSYR